MHPRASLATASGFVIAVVAVALLVTPTFRNAGRPHLLASVVEGEASFNGSPIRAGENISGTGTINVPARSMLLLSRGEEMTIELADGAVFTIDRLDHGSDRLEIAGTLAGGTLVSRVREGTTSIRYRYDTPGARIEPLGTEFLLQASGETTLLVMKSGSVRVTSLLSSREAVLSAGTRGTVNETIELSPAGLDDIRMIDDSRGRREGRFSTRLLAAVPGSLHDPGGIGPRMGSRDRGRERNHSPGGTIEKRKEPVGAGIQRRNTPRPEQLETRRDGSIKKKIEKLRDARTRRTGATPERKRIRR